MTTAGQRGLAPARAVLDNGAVIIAKQSRTTPAVTIDATIAAGTIYEPAGLDGIAHFVSRTIDRGTSSHSADAIAEALDSRGVSLSVTVNRHVLSLICTCLVEDVEPVLSLMADIVTNPTFPDAEVRTRRAEIVTMIRQDEDNPAVVAVERLLAYLYGDTHGYGRRARGSAASVASVDRAALVRFHAARFSPRALSLVLVGDIAPDAAIAAAAKAFGRWDAPAPPPVELPPPPAASARRVCVIPMMNKAQVDVAYGFTSLRRSDPAYYAYWLMNNILGQYSLGGRLGDRIRERQGMAYYVFSSFDANVIPGPLIIRAGVSPENVDPAIASIDQELERLAADGPTEGELTESKQYLIGSMPRALETNAGIAAYLQTEEFFGLGLDYDLQVPGFLRAVTRDEVHAAARRTLRPAEATIVVAGPYAGNAR